MVTSLAERVTFFDRMVTSRGAVVSSERGLGGFARCSVALRFSRAFCQLAALLHQPIAPPLPRQQLQGLKMDQIPRHLPSGDSEVRGEGSLVPVPRGQDEGQQPYLIPLKGRRVLRPRRFPSFVCCHLLPPPSLLPTIR